MIQTTSAGPRKWRRHVTIAAWCSLLLTYSPSTFAHEEDVGHRYQPRLVDPAKDPERFSSKRYGALEFRAGPYWIQIDREFATATPYEDAFGSKPAWAFGLEGDWQAARIPHFGSIGPGIGWHFVNRNSIAEFTNGDSGSVHPDRLWMMPMFAVAVVRIDVLKRDFSIPIVPYGKFGFAATLWEARDARTVSEVDGMVGRGLETGWSLHLGGMIHLNPLAPANAAEMDATTGVNDMYLYGEWWLSDVDSFGKGMQTGSNTVSFGLAFEF